MSTFSGSILIKKKAELQEIASALSLPDIGTREDLLTRIKKYIDEHQAELEDNPKLSGLVSSRKRQRSVQPAASSNSTHSGPSNARVVLTSSRSNIVSIKEDEEEDRETTPVAHDLNDVSVMIPSTSATTPFATRTATSSDTLATPSSLPPLPPSPAKSILADALAAPEVQAVVEMERSAVRSIKSALIQTRALLSDASTLYVLSALLDVTGLFLTIYQDNVFMLPSLRETPIPSIYATFFALFHWSLPAVVLPAIVGHLISFAQPRTPSDGSSSPLTFDPLTASIVRVASTLVYSFPHIRITTTGDAINVQHLLNGTPPVVVSGEVHSLDVLTVQWRLFTSVLALAFATAESLGRAGVSAPKAANRTLSREATPAKL